MIISISGAIGSGKDTIAKLIQELDTNSNWEIKKFAGKLKQIATMLTGVPIECWEDQEFKQNMLNSEWSMTGRDLLQKLGTEAMRNGLHENVWVNALLSDYSCTIKAFGTDEFNVIDADVYPNWIITDTRFPNELEAVKKRDGILIKVIRPDNANTIGTGHASETALNEFTEWDFVIENSGTIEDLKQKVSEILTHEKLFTIGIFK